MENSEYFSQNIKGRAKALIPKRRKLLTIDMNNKSNKRTRTENEKTGNKIFDLLTKDKKTEKDVIMGTQEVTKSSNKSENSLTKAKEINWANEVEENTKVGKENKKPAFLENK